MIAKLVEGVDINLNLKDRQEAERTGRLECMTAGGSMKIILNIVDEVTNWAPERMEASGFHIDAIPHGARKEDRTGYEIFLSRKRWHELTNPDCDPVVYGGHFSSRCLFDRAEFHYWGLYPTFAPDS